MLQLVVPGDEAYDEDTKKFTSINDTVLELEHSLVSLSKWESEFEKPFLSEEKKSFTEIVSYVKAMILTPEYPEDIFSRLSRKNFETIDEYMNARMTATWVNDVRPQTRSREAITSEVIYFWMVSFNIPFECQYWHLNRLLMLIQVCNAKQSTDQKMSRAELAARNRALNAERRARMNTTG